MPKVTFECNQSFVSHVSEIYLFYKSKILALLQTYDNSFRSAKGEVLKRKNLVVCSYEAQTLRNRCITSPLPSQQFLERAGEVLSRNVHFTKITVLPPCIT